MKNTINRIGLIITIVTMIILFAFSANAKEIIDSGEWGADGDNVTWVLYDDGELVFSGNGDMKYTLFQNDDIIEHIIPPYKSTYAEFIKSVIIEDGITSIGNYAFLDCKNLERVSMADSVTKIEYRAFSGCENLKEIDVSDNLVSIGDSAFSQCYNLSNIFIGNGVENIGYYAFSDCWRLVDITISDNVSNIGTGAFNYCYSLENIIVHEDNNFFSDLDGVLFNKEKTALIKFPISKKCNSYEVPYGVKRIESAAFQNCYNITEIRLPETIEFIGDYSFNSCMYLKMVVLPENVITISKGAFDNCFSLKNIIVENCDVVFENSVCHTEILPKDMTMEEWLSKILVLVGNGSPIEWRINFESFILEHSIFLDEPIALPNIIIYSHDPSTAKTYAEENGIPFKNISELEEPHTCSFGEWFTETAPTVFSEGVSKRVCECGEFETKPIAKLESASAKDETTKVEITYTEENFESEVEIVVSEEEINANIVFGDEFENIKSYDISLEAGGEKIQPKGYVTVKLPIPEGFNADSTVVYYVDDSGNKTKLESTTENGYVIFETDHFSEYVLVDESSKIEPPHVHSYTASITKEATCTENGTTTYTCSCGDSYNETIEATGHDFDGSKCKNCDYDKADTCGCNCHKGGIKGFFFKLILFFQKIFRTNKVCKCGINHY